MPYVPSEKTNPPAQDRNIIDAAIEPVAVLVASNITSNLTLIGIYKEFLEHLDRYLRHPKVVLSRRNLDETENLARAIVEVSTHYGYEGAYLGELNYACTRLIQRVPQIMVEKGLWKEEMRYWMWPATIEAFMCAADVARKYESGIGGVFLDVILEYKRRVNTAYEAAQILKSGDCFDAPHYTRLVEVVDDAGTLIGHQEIMLKRSEATLNQDLLDYQLVAKKRRNAT